MLNSVAEKTLFSGLVLFTNQVYAYLEEKEYLDYNLLGFSILLIVSGIDFNEDGQK